MAGTRVIDTGSDAGRVDSGSRNGAPMTVEEFCALTDTRPDEEKWELIEGEPVLNASPLDMHQWIVPNVVFALMIREREFKAP